MRAIRMFTFLVVVVAALGAAPGVASAGPDAIECVGHSTISPPNGYSVSISPGLKTERWTFTGVRDLCLADGSRVEAFLEGQITIFTHPDGTGRIVVPFKLTIAGGTLDGIVLTSFSPTSFDGRVHAFGGTGVLTGMTGKGTTLMTGPFTFDDQTWYRYA